MFRIGTGVAFMKRMTNLQSTADFLNMIEAAEFLRVKISTLYAWVHRRIIPHRKHGARTIFSKSELETWSQSRRVTEKSELSFFQIENNSKDRPTPLQRRRSLTTESDEKTMHVVSPKRR